MTTLYRNHPHLHNINTSSTSTQSMSNTHDSDSPTSHPLDTPSPGATDFSHGVGTAEGKRIRERRVMPARLQRVSSLLAGSIIEEEIAGAAAKEEANSGLPGSTTVILTTRDDIPVESVQPINTGEKTIILQNRELIETPDFRLRDDMEVMGKTRSMRSDEDTSDAAFERRHRKADNAEKRLRRWEKENLKKDRQKIVDRIDRLKAADTRMLAPILSAREDRQRLATGSGNGDNTTSNSDNSGVDSTAHQSKLEHLREELIEEHRVMLQRYDALLTVPTEEVPSDKVIGKRKKANDEDGNTSTADEAESSNKSSRTSNRRSISVSGAFARKSESNNGSSSANAPKSSSNLRASASTSSLPNTSTSANKKPNTKYIARDIKLRKVSMEERTPKPFTEKDGKVRAEHTYANIHARTSGGRFAPKNALASTAGGRPVGSTSKINSKMGRVKGGTQQPRKSSTSSTKKQATSKPSSVKKESSNADTSITSSAQSTPSRSARVRGKPSRSPTTVTESNVTQSPNDSSRTRRVRLILRNNKNGGDSVDPDDLNVNGMVDEIKRAGGTIKMDLDETLDSENELDSNLASSSKTPVRAALTIEEAQALLAKAMADGEDDDEDQDDLDAADAAASIPTRK